MFPVCPLQLSGSLSERLNMTTRLPTTTREPDRGNIDFSHDSQGPARACGSLCRCGRIIRWHLHHQTGRYWECAALYMASVFHKRQMSAVCCHTDEIRSKRMKRDCCSLFSPLTDGLHIKRTSCKSFLPTFFCVVSHRCMVFIWCFWSFHLCSRLAAALATNGVSKQVSCTKCLSWRQQ